MNPSTIRIGLVGVANHGTTILNAIRKADSLTLAAVHDVQTPAAEKVAGETGAHVAKNYEDMLADSNVQAVALVTPNHLHAQQIRAAMEAGKDVFVEKPITNTVAEAVGILTAARATGRVLMVGHNTRRRRVFRRAKELLQKEAIGRVVGVEGNLSRPAGLQPGLPPWKADPSACPLLPMTQLGIHLVDTVAYLIAPIEQVSCFAARIAMTGSVYDSTAAILRLANEIPFALTSYYVSPDAYFLRIYGTSGIIHCYPLSLRLETTRNGEPHEARNEDFRDEGAGSYILQMKEFGDCILHGRPPETGGEEGLNALAVIEAMTRSMTEGRHVAVRDIIRSAESDGVRT
jgi:predicted dehydrogenase